MRLTVEVGLVVGSLGARMERPPGPSWRPPQLGSCPQCGTTQLQAAHSAAPRTCSTRNTLPAALLCDYAVTAAGASSDQVTKGVNGSFHGIRRRVH